LEKEFSKITGYIPANQKGTSMKKIIFLGCTSFILFALATCNLSSGSPTPTPVDVSGLQTQAVETAYADLTRNAPTTTFTPTVTLTPTITPTLVPSLTPFPSVTPTEVKLSLENSLAIYMINVVDQENCQYETLPIPVNHGFTGDMLEDVRYSANYLLNTKWLSSGILTNPLGNASMYVASVEMIGDQMKITLDGNWYRYDDQCLNNEARDQLWATVWTAVRRYDLPIVNDISIWVGTLLFDDIMLKG
jgi:hypothetical protein